MREKWLLFPTIIYSCLKVIGVVLVYSDCLNCLLNIISYLFLAILFYFWNKRKKRIIQQTFVIPLPSKKIPFFVPIETGYYLFLWHLVTVMWVMSTYEQFIFHWVILTRQVAIPCGILFVLLEILLTSYYFIFLSQLTENKRFAQLMMEKGRYEVSYQLIQRLLLEEKVRIKGEDVTEELCRWVSYGVFQVFGTDNLKKVKPDESILLRLTPNARIFFSNEQTILETGVVVSDGGMMEKIR
ncbi:hypothetical protein OUS11_002111 [Enterococcus hirae]|nr:hypothetical protein [Enterococcus hirae]